MTDIQLLKTGFQPWLSNKDRVRLTMLVAEEGARREAAVVAAERDTGYAAAEEALSAANAHYRAVHAAHRSGVASDEELNAAYEMRYAAQQCLLFAFNAVNADIDKAYVRKV